MSKIIIEDLIKAKGQIEEKEKTIKIDAYSFIIGKIIPFNSKKHQTFYEIGKNTKRIISIGMTKSQMKLIKDTLGFKDKIPKKDVKFSKFDGIKIVEGK